MQNTYATFVLSFSLPPSLSLSISLSGLGRSTFFEGLTSYSSGFWLLISSLAGLNWPAPRSRNWKVLGSNVDSFQTPQSKTESGLGHLLRKQGANIT